MAYASGKWALAICQICGWTCKYSDLKMQVVNQIPTGLQVCPDCLDIDNPQLQVGKINRTPEAIALLRPSPDTGRQASTSFFGWLPVLGLTMQVSLGSVTVTTS